MRMEENKSVWGLNCFSVLSLHSELTMKASVWPVIRLWSLQIIPEEGNNLCLEVPRFRLCAIRITPFPIKSCSLELDRFTHAQATCRCYTRCRQDTVFEGKSQREWEICLSYSQPWEAPHWKAQLSPDDLLISSEKAWALSMNILLIAPKAIPGGKLVYKLQFP